MRSLSSTQREVIRNILQNLICSILDAETDEHTRGNRTDILLSALNGTTEGLTAFEEAAREFRESIENNTTITDANKSAILNSFIEPLLKLYRFCNAHEVTDYSESSVSTYSDTLPNFSTLGTSSNISDATILGYVCTLLHASGESFAREISSTQAETVLEEAFCNVESQIATGQQTAVQAR